MTTKIQLGPPKIRVWRRSGGPKLILDTFCRSMSVSKDLNSPEGHFTLTFHHDQGSRGPALGRNPPDLYRLLHSGDVVSIGFDRPGGIMLGIINRVTRKSLFSGPKTTHEITVTGSDFGKLLAQDNIVHAALTVGESPGYLAKIEAVTGPDHVLLVALSAAWGPDAKDASKEAVPGVFEQASPEDVINFILRFGASMTLPQLDGLAGGSSKPGEFIDTIASVTVWNDGRVQSAGLNDFQGSLWSFLKQIMDPDFYEVFITTIPVRGNDLPRVSLVVRPKPYDDPNEEFLPVEEQSGTTWPELVTLTEGLEHHEIHLSDVFNEQIGVGDADSFAYYEVAALFDLIGNAESRQEGLFYPVVDTFQLTKAGLRTYKATMKLMASAVKDKALGNAPTESLLHGEVREFRNRLVNWYRMADYYETGTMMVIGDDDYRPGDPVMALHHTPHFGPVKQSNPGVRYYCVGTQHRWAFGEHYTSQLELIRGHNSELFAAVNDEIAKTAPASNPRHRAEA